MEHHLQMFLLVELLQCHQIMVYLLWDKIMESLLRDKLTQLLQREHLMELLKLTVNLKSINMDSLSTVDQFMHLHHHQILITLLHLIHNTHLPLIPNNQIVSL